MSDLQDRIDYAQQELFEAEDHANACDFEVDQAQAEASYAWDLVSQAEQVLEMLQEQNDE